MDEKQGMELGHLPYKRATFEDYVGVRGLEEHGKKKWQRHVADVVKRLVAALEPDEVVRGGGNVKKLDALPAGTQAGDNDNAFRGGFRLWEKSTDGKLSCDYDLWRSLLNPSKREAASKSSLLRCRSKSNRLSP